ncbi:MAG TPA: FecR domain-containing protein [Stenotrophomonas sp.]|nr:FecR domain-containing protein [Stenotrophomonas sp.]
MSDTRPDPRIIQAAAQWHALHREGELGSAQQARFMAWLAASPEHLREYLALARMTAELGALLRGLPDAEAAAPVPARDDNVLAWPLQPRRPTPRSLPAPVRRRSRLLPRLSQAAALLLALGTGTSAWLAWPRTQHFSTGHGATRTLQLADGSAVHLNASSALSVRYSGFARSVTLEQGQASFVVAAGRRPFSVQAAGLRVRDIGTTFDVSLQREQARIGVAEGRVQVFAEGEPRLLADLQAGQSARVDYHDHEVRVADEDAAAITGWWQRRIVFRDESLREVADQFNRLNPTRVDVDDAAGALHLTGNLGADDVDSLFAFLQQQPGLATTRTERGIVVRARGAAKATTPAPARR